MMESKCRLGIFVEHCDTQEHFAIQSVPLALVFWKFSANTARMTGKELLEVKNKARFGLSRVSYPYFDVTFVIYMII